MHDGRDVTPPAMHDGRDELERGEQEVSIPDMQLPKPTIAQEKRGASSFQSYNRLHLSCLVFAQQI